MTLPIRVGHLGKYEATALLTITGITNLFLSTPQELIANGRQAGWMIPLVSTVVMLIVVLLFRKPLKTLSNIDFLIVNKAAWARIVSGNLAVLAILYCMLVTASDMRQFSETVLGTVLSRSPISFVTIPLLLVICYFVFAGLEPLSRVAWICTPIILGGLALLLISNRNWVHYEYLRPLFGVGMMPIFQSGFFFSFLFPNVFLLLIFAGALRNAADLPFVTVWSTVIIGACYSIATFVYVSIFHYQLAVNMSFPMYQMARIIHIGRFLERLESIFIFVWITCAIIKMSMFTWGATYLTARLFRMPIYRPLVFSTVVIIFAVSFLPRSYPELVVWDRLYLQQYGALYTIGIPVVLLVMHWISKERGNRSEKKMRRAT